MKQHGGHLTVHVVMTEHWAHEEGAAKTETTKTLRDKISEDLYYPRQYIQ